MTTAAQRPLLEQNAQKRRAINDLKFYSSFPWVSLGVATLTAAAAIYLFARWALTDNPSGQAVFSRNDCVFYSEDRGDRSDLNAWNLFSYCTDPDHYSSVSFDNPHCQDVAYPFDCLAKLSDECGKAFKTWCDMSKIDFFVGGATGLASVISMALFIYNFRIYHDGTVASLPASAKHTVTQAYRNVHEDADDQAISALRFSDVLEVLEPQRGGAVFR